jgi:hypothetical protein
MSTTISRPLRGCSQGGPQEKSANASCAFEAQTLIFQKDFLTEAVLSYLLVIGTSFFKATVSVQK